MAIELTPLNSQYKIVAIYFSYVKQKKFKHRPKIMSENIQTNKQTNKQNKKEKKREKNSIKKNFNKKLPTTQMMRSLDIEERGTSHFCI